MSFPLKEKKKFKNAKYVPVQSTVIETQKHRKKNKDCKINICIPFTNMLYPLLFLWTSVPTTCNDSSKIDIFAVNPLFRKTTNSAFQFCKPTLLKMFIVFSIRIMTDVNLNKRNAQRLESATVFCMWSMSLIQYIPDAFYTNLVFLMFQTGLLPYLFKPLIWNVHANVAENLCNLQNNTIHVILVSIFFKLYRFWVLHILPISICQRIFSHS